MVNPFPLLSAAIPESSLIDSTSLMEKSLRIAQFARAFSIFRIRKIYIYRDVSTVKSDDVKLLSLLLGYLDTPQYLRRSLYPKIKLLQFVGMLPPIQSPHHKKFLKLSKVRDGETRVGLLLMNKGSWVVDVGLNQTVPFVGMNGTKRKSIFRLRTFNGKLVAEEMKKGVSGYWGYRIDHVHSLSSIIRSSKAKLIITSRMGKSISLCRNALMSSLSDFSEVVLVFGSPRKEVWEIVNKTDGIVVDSSLCINMFPQQGTESVRLEEAVMGSLAIINSFRSDRDDTRAF
jgi:predicted SPOUT superfamily RNA methylase MTH1